jgi:CheY-like chemotaxis protein
MERKILLIEDNPHKQSRILEFLESFDSNLQIHTAMSFTSGCKAAESEVFDLIVLDISLPTYDRSPAESGGRFRILGGREIARKLMRKGTAPKMFFLTQYSSFSDKGTSYTFDSLSDELSIECGSAFQGMIYFETTSSKWKNALGQAVREIC